MKMLNTLPLIQGFLRLAYSPVLLAQAFGTALVLGVVGGVYPAWRASRLQPVAPSCWARRSFFSSPSNGRRPMRMFADSFFLHHEARSARSTTTVGTSAPGPFARRIVGRLALSLCEKPVGPRRPMGVGGRE